MIESMTGFGKGEASAKGVTFSVELRSVNNRFLEISTRAPKTISQRENEIKDIVRSKIARGKISLSATKEDGNDNELAISVDKKRTKEIYAVLEQLRKTTKIKEPVTLEHLLHFSEIFETKEVEEDETEWKVFQQALTKAVSSLKTMREKEGAELARDSKERVQKINKHIDTVEQLSKKRIPEERKRLLEKVEQLVEDKSIINNQRLELEIALLSEKLDVTEECVRFRSHNKFFLEALQSKESEGRKLNFLIQEMGREANTIGSKCNDVEIAHIVVGIKEELEKIREQLQNIE
ncbi:MAG: YicC/YloC family endoribonuclease [Bacteroidota bacterium]|nr:YicC/YloC family endoribonuclease [Bacteroidota bacterium]